MRKSHQEIAAPKATLDVNEIADAEVAEPQSEKQTSDQTVAKQAKNKKFFTTQRITQLAIFVAMALVLKLLGKSLTITPTFTVTFIYLPWLLSGVVLGPIGGMIVGGISDILGNFIFGSPFIPLTFVSNTLFALPIGLIYKFAPIKNDYIKCAIGAVCSLFLCTLGIGSLALWQFYKYYETINFFSYLLVFRLPQVGVFSINVAVLLALITPMQSVGIFPVSRSATLRVPRKVIFSGCIVLFTSLFVTAIVLISMKYAKEVLVTPEIAWSYATTYVAVSAIYSALILQSIMIVTSKNRLATILITAGTAVALAIALTFTLIEKSKDIEFIYLLCIAAAIVALLVVIGVAVRKGNIRRKQNK